MTLRIKMVVNPGYTPEEVKVLELLEKEGKLSPVSTDEFHVCACEIGPDGLIYHALHFKSLEDATAFYKGQGAIVVIGTRMKIA